MINTTFKTVTTTGAPPANKAYTTAVVITARWPQVSNTEFSYSTYSRRHVIGYRWRSASLWLVTQVGQSTISQLQLWEWSVATSSQLFDWQLRDLDICLFYVFYVPSVLWRCWLGGRKGIRPVKNWVVGCWRGYLSGVRCRLAHSPADATATHCLLLQ